MRAPQGTGVASVWSLAAHREPSRNLQNKLNWVHPLLYVGAHRELNTEEHRVHGRCSPVSPRSISATRAVVSQSGEFITGGALDNYLATPWSATGPPHGIISASHSDGTTDLEQEARWRPNMLSSNARNRASWTRRSAVRSHRRSRALTRPVP